MQGKIAFFVLMSLILAACGPREDQPVARPGFTPVPIPGSTARVLLEDASLRQEGDLTTGNLLTELPKGEYILQGVRLDGQGRFQRLAGGRHRKDGTLAAALPGETGWQPVSADPVMLAVRDAVLARIQASRPQAEEIDPAKAMQQVFGNFDAAQGVSRWRPRLPQALGENDFFPPGEEALAHKALAQLFEEDGKIKYLLLTQSRPAGETFDCHACAPLLSGFVFRYDNGTWHLETEDRYITFAGKYGEAPGGKVLQMGKGRFGVILTGEDTAQGYSTRYALFLAPRQGRFQDLLELDLGGNNEGACAAGKKDKHYWSYTTQYEFVAPGAGPFYDLKVTVRGTRGGRGGKRISANSEKYLVFNGERYVEKSRPPQSPPPASPENKKPGPE